MTRALIGLGLAALLFGGRVHARQSAPAAAAPPEYQQIKAFALGGDSIALEKFAFTRDRVTMTLSGTVYFATPVAGHVTGAVFIGDGTVHADVPPTPGDFEKGSVQRLLGADAVDSDFKTAVFRMTDDSAAVLRAGAAPAAARTIAAAVPPDATKLAAAFEPRLLHETGINLSSRLAMSILNGETPGVFVAEFDGGRRGRFDVTV